MTVIALFIITAISWVMVLRNAGSMVMPAATPSLVEASVFTVQWGVMMAAMMLPSAMPMILMYRTVSQRLAGAGEQAIPVALFTATYLAVWLMLGVPVYAGYVLVARASAASPSVHALIPYAVAGVLVAAGAYQFSHLKHVCLRYCEAPLSFLMRRWRSGYRQTFRIGLEHAAYCVGCCWGLMLILIVAGAMGPVWVLTIAALLVTEKVLPRGHRTARLIGVALIVLGVVVALQPELAMMLRGTTDMPASMQMD